MWYNDSSLFMNDVYYLFIVKYPLSVFYNEQRVISILLYYDFWLGLSLFNFVLTSVRATI